jgi:hypothetical protein
MSNLDTPKAIIIAALIVSATIIGLLLAATGTAFTQQPTFPFMREGGERTAFVGGSYRTCLEKQRAVAENASLSTPELGAFCLCYGRALADAINGAEYDALTVGQLPESFVRKTQVASNICLVRITPSRQTSKREQLIVALENRCRKEYHPEDTDFAAAQVRERFCGCFAEAVTKSGKEQKNPNEAADYCSRRL